MKKKVSIDKNNIEQLKASKAHWLSLWFSSFSKLASDVVGSPFIFLLAVLLILGWLISGPLFNYSETWQLIINTGTTIITFLIVFLIQHTQNRDTEIINLKLDELIKGHRGSNNTIMDLSQLSDEELKELEKNYQKLCNKHTGG